MLGTVMSANETVTNTTATNSTAANNTTAEGKPMDVLFIEEWPLFTFRPRRIFNYMARWMDFVDSMLDAEFDEMYRFLDAPLHHLEPKNETNSTTEQVNATTNENTTTTERPKITKHFYSSSTSIYRGPDGVEHIVHDETGDDGVHHKTETRRIKDRSLTTHTVAKGDEKPSVKNSLVGLLENETESFLAQFEKLIHPTEQLPKEAGETNATATNTDAEAVNM